LDPKGTENYNMLKAFVGWDCRNIIEGVSKLKKFDIRKFRLAIKKNK